MTDSVINEPEAAVEVTPIVIQNGLELLEVSAKTNLETRGASTKDGKLSRGVSTNDFGVSSKSSKSVRKKSMLPPGLTLEEINKQIAEVREKRKELEPNEGRVQGARVDYSVRPKKTFHHPKLDYVIGEAVHSPYLIKPQDQYPKETFTMNHTLRELKREGKVLAEVPHEEKPFNPRQAKNKFIREVANFNPTYSMANAVSPDGKTSIRASTGQLDKLLEIFNQGTRSTAGQGEYKSATMQAAEARGGPVKFKKQLSGLVARRTPSASAMSGDDTLGFEGSTSSYYTSDMANEPSELPAGITLPVDPDVSVIYGIEETENENLTTTSSEDKAAILAQQQAILNAYNKANGTYVITEDENEDVVTPTAAEVAARLKKKQEEEKEQTDKTTRSQKLKPTETSEDGYQEEEFADEEEQKKLQLQQQSSKSASLLAPINTTAVTSSAVECVSPVPVHQLGGSANNSSSALSSLAPGGSSSKGSAKVAVTMAVSAPEETYDLNEFNEAPATVESSGPGTSSSYVVDALSPVDNSGGVNYDDMVLGGDSVEEIPDDTVGGGNVLEESYSHIEQIEYKDDFNTLEESTGNDGPIKNQKDNFVEAPSQ